MDLRQRLTAAGPKRVLALDGGGVRGIVTVAFLDQIEQVLRARHNRPDLRLADYFDLIGGTSVGAILAAGLALGMDVATMRSLFVELAHAAFSRRRRMRVGSARYNPGPLETILQRVFGELTLGDPALRTGLCIVTKRADTGHTWPLLNHPDGQFYAANAPILLRDALRASAAAPTYFEPERLRVKHDEYGVFIDGGVSPAKNPALQLFLIATLDGYRFRWRTGSEQLLLVSVGTGTWRRTDSLQRVLGRRVWNWATEVPGMLLDDASWLNQLLLQYLSCSPTAWAIDAEIGDLSADLLTPEPALAYIRYDALLEASGLQALELADRLGDVRALRELSAADRLADLALIGQRAAARQVRPAHFPPAFDLTPA